MNKKLKIALMSYTMDNRQAKGTALYARRLVENLLDDDRFDISLVHFSQGNDPLYKKTNEIIMPRVKLPYGTRFISQLLFFWRYRKNKFDIIHWFQPRVYPFFWLAPAKKIVITIHGAGDISAPNSFVFSRTVFNFILTHFYKYVDIFIADSNDAKNEVAKYYGIPLNKIERIYLGGGDNYRVIERNEARREICNKYNIFGPYILNVSRLQPHKNITTLIKAYTLLRKKDCLRTEKLVIVGNATNKGRPVEYDVARESPFSDDIFFVDHVDPEDMNIFYSSAELFVFPSLSEGFGLPILESMASGTPVITSKTTSLGEIAGNAAITVDPLDAEALALAMGRVLNDQKLAKSMILSGLTRVANFTWRNMADQTKELYIKLFNSEKRESLGCCFCGSRFRSETIDNHMDFGVEYFLYECLECGVQFWTPFKNPGSVWYEQDERYKYANDNPTIEIGTSHQIVLNFLNDSRGKVFDIGCGTGNFLYFAKKKGWDVFGIDFDRNAVNTAKNILSLPNIEQATLEEYVNARRGNGEKYDLVTFFDVFEHIDSHIQFINLVKKILTPRGYLAMSMPYRNGSRWLMPHDLPPRHLTRWDRKSLKLFFENNGFEVVYLRRNPATLFDVVMKIRFKYGGFLSFNLVKKIKNKQPLSCEGQSGAVSKKTKLIHLLAKLKDICFFGIPAISIWLYLLVSRKVYTSLVAIVRKKD